jgi:hypothetical protein
MKILPLPEFSQMPSRVQPVGHGSPVVTLGVYGHMFRDTGRTAADAIEAVLKK